MAGGALAAYKKTLAAPVEASCSGMRADSCFNRCVAGRGRRVARPRSCDSGIVGIGSRSSAPSPWLHAGVDTVFTGCAIATISVLPKYCGSFACSTATFRMASPSSGIVTARTGLRLSLPGWPGIRALSSNGFRPMLLISTLRNRSGAIPSTVIWPTSPQQISNIWKTGSSPHSFTNGESVACSHHSSAHLNWNYDMYHYLCKGQ